MYTVAGICKKYINIQIKFTDISHIMDIIKIKGGINSMGIIFITAILICIMYGLTFLSYLTESHILDDISLENL